MATQYKFSRELKPYFWLLLNLFVSLVVFSLILLNRSPNLLRPISMSLRTGFGLVIPVTALLLYASFRVQNRVGDLISMSLTLSLFAMPLAGLWASGQSQSISISGLIPLADAAYYYHDSLRIMSGWNISNFSAMRPFFAGFLSLIMNITDRNFMFSMAVITAIAGIAIYYAVREVQRTHGTEIAVFLLIILFLYFRHHSGTSMSETLGVPLGALGLGLIWRGLERQSQNLSIFGLFICAFALNVRPGPMFILPFMLLWLAWVFKKPAEYISIKYILWGTGAIILAFALNSMLIRILAGPSGTAFSNFSWALYGLASGGKSFNYIAETHPEVFLLQDPERSRTIYRMTFDLILHNPGLLVSGAVFRWSTFFAGAWYSAFSFVGGENDYVNLIARWSMYCLCILGFLQWFLKPGDRYSGLVIMASLGILASVPFVPPTDAYRVRLYAASIFIFGLLPGMGLSLIMNLTKFKMFSMPDPQTQESNVSVWFSALFITAVVFAPLIVKASSPIPPPLDVTCPAGSDKIAIRFDPGSSINIMREKEQFLDWAPNFHQGLFNRNAHSLSEIKFISYLEALNPQTSILSSVDYLSGRPALIFVPTRVLPQSGTYIGICGHWETRPILNQNDIFLGNEVIVLNEK